MSNNYNGNYQVGTSPLHNLNPTVKMVMLFMFVLICLFKYNYYLLIGILLITAINIFLSAIHIKYYINVIFKFIFFLMLEAVVLYRYHIAIQSITIINVKVVALVLYLLMILYTTSSDHLGRAIARIISIFDFGGNNKKKIEKKMVGIFKKIYYKANTKKNLLISQMISSSIRKDDSKVTTIISIFKNRKKIKEETKQSFSEYEIEGKYKLDGWKNNSYQYHKKIFIFEILYFMVHFSLIIYYILKVR